MTQTVVVQEQAVENLTLAPKMRLRNLNRMKQDLYIFQINLRGTSATTSIAWETLGFTGQELESIKASEAKLSSIPLFKALKAAALTLTSQRQAIYNNMIRAEGMSACTVEKLPQVWSEFQALQQTAQQLRQQLESEYDSGKEEFTSRLSQLLGNQKFGLKPEEIDLHLDKLLQKFPSLAQLQNYLQVSLGAFELIPSIESQLLVEATMVDAEAKRQEAVNRERAAQIVAEIQEQRAQDIEKLRQEMVNSARGECQQMLVKLIQSLSKFEPGKASKRLKSSLNSHIDRLEALLGADIDGSLNEVFDKLVQVQATVSQDRSELDRDTKSQLQAQIDALRSELETEQLKLLSSNNAGMTKATILQMDWSA